MSSDSIPPKPFGIIYLAVNKINGKKYIGQTMRSLQARIRAHFTQGGTRAVFPRAIQKYGLDAFEFSVVDSADDIETLNAKEKQWIAQLGCLLPHGYNCAVGGGNGPMLDDTKQKLSEAAKLRPPRVGGWKLSEETKSKLRAARLGKKRTAPVTEQERINRSLAHLGRKLGPLKEETKRKLSQRLSGAGNPMFGRKRPGMNAGENNPMFGKKCPGAAAAGRLKVGAANPMFGIGGMKGKRHSEETRRKMSETHKRKHARPDDFSSKTRPD